MPILLYAEHVFSYLCMSFNADATIKLRFEKKNKILS